MQSKNRHSKVSLAELTAREQFIQGICNFCDDWCQRCPKTQNCLSYAHNKESKGIDFSKENSDSTNASFWFAVDRYNTWATNLSKLLNGSEQTELSILLLAEKFAEECKTWIDKNRSSFPAYVDKVLIENSPINVTFSDMVDILEWYGTLIPKKLERALKEYDLRKNIDPEEEHNPFKDNIGSAKMAMVACNRSLIAFSYIVMELVEEKEAVTDLASMLLGIIDEITTYFPAVKEFVRPGLDE